MSKIMKKISKKRNLLSSKKQSNKLKEKETLNNIVEEKYQTSDQILIKGNFEFELIEGEYEIDGYQLKSSVKINWNQPNYLLLKGEGKYKISNDAQISTDSNKFHYVITDQVQKSISIVMEKKKQKIVILGDKNTGKSVICQLLINQLLNENTKAYLLDCDLGQGFGTPGFITLFQISNPFFIKFPEIIFQGFVGEFTTLNHIELYLIQLKQAMTQYNSMEIRQFPLVVNTHGFVTNYGVSILQKINKIVGGDCQMLIECKKTDTFLNEFRGDNFLSDESFQQMDILTVQNEFIKQISVEVVNQINSYNNPHSKKKRRQIQLLKTIGVETLEHVYLSICLQEVQRVPLQDIQFICLPFGFEYNHLISQFVSIPIEIARIFCGSFVGISSVRQVVEGNYLGVGFVKDVDLINNQLLVITKVKIEGQMNFVKSKNFEVGKDCMRIKGDQFLEELDYQFVISNAALVAEIEVPYLYSKFEAIGIEGLNVKRKMK